MNAEDHEALYMIRERNGRREIERVLAELRAEEAAADDEAFADVVEQLARAAL